MDILTEIVEKRKNMVTQTGFTMGEDVPEEREVPVVPFVRDPLLVCEIKRKSPSKGDISLRLDAAGQAEQYYRKGIRSVSVLTEPNYFAGSLSDLIRVKRTFPDLAVLRKDFLFSKEDVEVSYRAGADAVLLIAAILDEDALETMYRKAKGLGMEVLLEVHDENDITKAAGVRPVLTGINARDLTTFTIDLTIPLRLKPHITWPTSLIFESGILREEDAALPLSSGFRGLLIGEAVVKNSGLIDEILSLFPGTSRRFWTRLYGARPPYVKICGITREDDAYHAADAGADILGFVFAPSPRMAEPALLEKIGNCDILKVAVVVTDRGSRELDGRVRGLLERGLLDAVQFHGDERPDECYTMAFPYYKALRIRDADDCKRISDYRCPRVLIDAFSSAARGGTGKQIPHDLIGEVQKAGPLWLAGGMGPETISEIMQRFTPELVDASSRLESAPGEKDPDKVNAFIDAVKKVHQSR
ncbi:MAG: bifunctional indole-3-glycerol phosphate synthase/phosphoribosylanthranilate isomerase [Spirochaetales bacterium]|nr:bifunctional indole-3-glycerol phosphate synthase/phosphoribosylanthranilate isomerase [Spirochaetales bacterium]